MCRCPWFCRSCPQRGRKMVLPQETVSEFSPAMCKLRLLFACRKKTLEPWDASWSFCGTVMTAPRPWGSCGRASLAESRRPWRAAARQSLPEQARLPASAGAGHAGMVGLRSDKSSACMGGGSHYLRGSKWEYKMEPAQGCVLSLTAHPRKARECCPSCCLQLRKYYYFPAFLLCCFLQQDVLLYFITVLLSSM